jgi:hypothetical protein
MAKKAVSVTLDENNVLWLKGRARLSSGGTLSQTLDQLITQARTGRVLPGRPPSVVGLVDLSDDPDLSKAEATVKQFWDQRHDGFAVHEEPPRPRNAKRKRRRG